MQQHPDERLTFIDLNLLPRENWLRSYSTLYAGVAALILIAALLLIPLNRANSSAADDAGDLKDELARIDRELADEEVNQGRLREVRLQTNATRLAIDELVAERNAVLGSEAKISSAVTDLLASMPQDIAVNSISSGESTVLLAGEAPDSQAALDYARALDDTGAFATVQIASLSLEDSANGVSFTVEVGL
jgi:Tfp pilus assembly protein PilN